VGRAFKTVLSERWGNIPDGGYAFDSMYVQLGMGSRHCGVQPKLWDREPPVRHGHRLHGRFSSGGRAGRSRRIHLVPRRSPPRAVSSHGVHEGAGAVCHVYEHDGQRSVSRSIGPALLWRRMSGT